MPFLAREQCRWIDMAGLYYNCFSISFDLSYARTPSLVMDHDFSKAIALLQIAVGFMSVFKIEDPVDHRMDPVLANDSIHGFQITATTYTNGFVVGLTKDQIHDIQRLHGFSQGADQGHLPTYSNRFDGSCNCHRATDIDHTTCAFAMCIVSYKLGPFWRVFVVENLVSP